LKDLIVDILKIVTPVSVALIVFAQGLGIALSQVGTYFREESGLMLRSLIAPLVLVPAVAVSIGHLPGPRDPAREDQPRGGMRGPPSRVGAHIPVANFGRPEALPVLVPCVLTFIAVAMVYLFWRGRSR
jgi:hypothetical protein